MEAPSRVRETVAKLTGSPVWESEKMAVTTFCAERPKLQKKQQNKRQILNFIMDIRCEKGTKVYFTLSGFSAMNFFHDDEPPFPLSGLVRE